MEPGTFAGLRVSSAPSRVLGNSPGGLVQEAKLAEGAPVSALRSWSFWQGREQSCPSLLSVSHSPEVTTAKIKLMAHAGSTARGWLLMATALKYC